MLDVQQKLKLDTSPYSGLYDIVVSKDHELRKILNLIDFTFVYDELKSKYTPNMGRKAIDPIILFKYLLLKEMYDLSDMDLVKQSMVNMAFKYFLGYNPEDKVIESSTLTKFRKLRLQDDELLNKLIRKTVEVAISEGVLKSTTIVIDATHTIARFNHSSGLEMLQKRSHNLRSILYKFFPNIAEQMPQKPEVKDLKEELSYSKELSLKVKQSILDKYEVIPDNINEKLNILEETIEDIEEERSVSEDPDAKDGHKSAESSFFGYKTNIATSSERIITAAVVTSGETFDGHYLPELVEQSKKNGVDVKDVVGDGAYSGRNCIDYTKENNINLISKLNINVLNSSDYKKYGFNFNKDANRLVCKAGKLSYIYRNNYFYFPLCQCGNCIHIKECKSIPYYQKKSKTIYIKISKESKRIRDLYPDFINFQSSDYFKEKYRERYIIEAKNGELKNRHGYDKARSAGIQSMNIQGAFVFFAVNLKRIMTLMEKKS